MKSKQLTCKKMYIGCYKHMNRESLKYNGTRMNINHGKMQPIKTQPIKTQKSRSKRRSTIKSKR